MTREDNFFNKATEEIKNSYAFQNDESYSESDVRDIAVSLAEHGYQYARKNLYFDADGDYVPEYDREVIVIGYSGKVFYGHRPNPKQVTMIDGKPYYPKTCGKNGWNLPDIALWLDVEVPEKLIDEITTKYFEEHEQLPRRTEKCI